MLIVKEWRCSVCPPDKVVLTQMTPNSHIMEILVQDDTSKDGASVFVSKGAAREMAAFLLEFAGALTAKTQPGAIPALLPCPFCGSAGKMISCMGAWVPGGYEPNGSRIVCSADDCSGSGWPFYGDDKDERAAAQWNTRAALASPQPVDNPRVEIERLRGELEDLQEKVGMAIMALPPAKGYRMLPLNEAIGALRKDTEARVAQLEEALGALHHAVCGETGFAAAVRSCSGLAYPWPALDDADLLARAALATKETVEAKS